MTDSLELPEPLHNEIKKHCAEGDVLADAKNYEAAITEYEKALNLVPEPKTEWEASTWILAAIADACYMSGFNTSALEALEYAMTCPGAVGNPFLHLRLGQLKYDAGELDPAADELMRAYMGAGEDIFKAEDSKYLNFLKTRAKI